MISPEEIKALEAEVNKLKFKAGQKGGELHDLVEDRLLLEFEDLIPFAETTYEACKKWSDLNKELIKAKKG
ncbi:CCE_0567 family metalloprotein [Labilibacter marinus]|uniref:CCE_0567 family metalloprotein n=1 Tax=Labilibacter marinus TaxID=1477105 RepID=UPI0018E9412F|nr:CCE_0567 family metalloprotein [Labilibacter marinus]